MNQHVDNTDEQEIFCVVLQKKAPKAAEPFYSGELGERIHNHVSEEGWKRWLQELAMIVNENGLQTGDPMAMDLIEQYMVGYLFQEGDFADRSHFVPPNPKVQ